MLRELNDVEINGWHLKTREPTVKDNNPTTLLLHGWSGDESAMWVFARAIPEDHFIVAPRGIHSTDIGGYGWSTNIDGWPQIIDFGESIDALVELIETLAMNFPGYDLKHIGVMGFSQGASLGYSFSLRFPERIKYIVGLSGFLPDGVGYLVKRKILLDVPIFIAHGTKDELVPVARARQAVHLLKNAGAAMTYCEDDVNHKLSTSCFQGLDYFFKNTLT